MDDWEKFNETTLSEKEFYSNLNMEMLIICMQKKLGEYHSLHLKSHILLLADIFENFRKMCLKTYNLNPVKFLSAPGLAWQTALKKTAVKLELLTDTDMLSMVEE